MVKNVEFKEGTDIFPEKGGIPKQEDKIKQGG